MAVAPVAPAAPPAPPAPATVAALSARLPVAEAADMAARTPAHFAAFELEIWKRAEEELRGYARMRVGLAPAIRLLP